MSTSEMEAQPVQDVSSSEEALYDTDKPRPLEKSSVVINKTPELGSGKFEKYDEVHMTVKINGTRSKGLFTIYKSRANAGGWFEYQLKQSDGTLYNNGEWFREKDLRLNKRG